MLLYTFALQEDKVKVIDVSTTEFATVIILMIARSC